MAGDCLVDPDAKPYLNVDPLVVLVVAVTTLMIGITAVTMLARWCDYRSNNASPSSRALRVRHSLRARTKTFLYVHTKIGISWEVQPIGN